jgi:hypothetical protein
VTSAYGAQSKFARHVGVDKSVISRASSGKGGKLDLLTFERKPNLM